MNPRLSIQGRMSLDGWNGAGGTPFGGGHSRQDSTGAAGAGGHARRGSANYRPGGPQQPQMIFNAFEEDPGVDVMGLERLAEVDEDLETDEDDDEVDANERTHLRTIRGRGGSGGGGVRSGSHSPRAGSQGGDSRRSPH